MAPIYDGEIYKCMQCDITYDFKYQTLTYRHFLKYGKHLSWEHLHHRCTYGDDIFDRDIIYLPWLPFDITRERLKTCHSYEEKEN
jgi:hypothetical protein